MPSPLHGLLLFTGCCSQSLPANIESELSLYLTKRVAIHTSPSLSLAVIKNGKVVYAKAVGFADLENDVPATPKTVYRLGSITKQFTATMVMQLINEKKLSLDEPIGQVLPATPEAWTKVTVRNLLNHTSGIKSYTEVSGLFEGPAMQPTTPSGIIKTIEKDPLDFTPGSKWHYDNTGYEVLGMIIEKLDGRKYAESLKKRILVPLAMTDTYFTSERAIVKHRAQGYSPANGEFQHAPYLNMDWPYAAGSMESTTLDLAKWDAALYGNQILSQDSLSQMWTPTILSSGAKQNYGFGWMFESVNGVKEVEHGGGIHGFATFIKRVPTKGLTIVVLANSDAADCSSVARDALGIVDPSFKVVPPKSVVNNDQISQLLKKTLQAILDGNLDHRLLTAEFAKVLTPDLEQGAKAQLSAMGKLNKFEMIETSTVAGKTTRSYRVTLGNSDLTLEAVIDQQGLIAGLTFKP